MKIAVFGGSGFIGSHVADELSCNGHEVIIFDLHKSPYLRDEQKMVTGDIRDKDRVRQAVAGCDAVYNFAGIADLDDATTKPVTTVELNVLGNINIMEACVEQNVKRFIYASSIYVYSQKGGFYRCSKQAAETYIEEFYNQYGLPYTILRYGSLYGPRADNRNAIYNYMYQALNERKIVCSNPEEMREYIHVYDAAQLSVQILNGEFENDYIILTGHYRMKVREMMDIIREMLNYDVEVDYQELPRSKWHYSYTPYSFTPKIGKKLVNNRYVDIGQGFLECLTDVHEHLQASAPEPKL